MTIDAISSAPRRAKARTLLARHPVAIECARAAAEIVQGAAEVVIFEGDRAFIVGSADLAGMMQPRPLRAVEKQLIDQTLADPGTSMAATDPDGGAFPLVSGQGDIVGSLTVTCERSVVQTEALHALARAVSSIALEAAPENPDVENAFEAAALQGLRDAVVVVDSDLNVIWANRAVGSLFGRTPGELIGHSAVNFVHPDDIASTFTAITRMNEGLEMYRVYLRLQAKSGEYVPVEVTGIDHAADERIGGLVLSLRSDEREAEADAAMRRNRQISDAILGGLTDGIVATDEFGAVTRVNNAARQMFGLDPQQPDGQFSLSDFRAADADGHTVTIGQSADEPDAVALGALCVVSSRGELRYVTMQHQSVSDDVGGAVGTVVVFHDVTAERRAADELRNQALHDQLTGLANRRQLDQRLAELATVRPVVSVAACFIDLDGFKLINDTYGHRTGDQLIRIAADRLQAELRDGDLLVRQGGDEFVVLQIGIANAAEAIANAERLRVSLGHPYSIGDDRFDLTTSIGVSVADSTELTEETLLQQADIALYAAKAQGRNRVEAFDDDLAEAVRLEEHQRRMLRDALENDRLVMHFQPLVDADTGLTHGYEALARIRTEQGELIGPGGFLESVTSSGLIWDLDQAAFGLACQAAEMMARVEPERPPMIASNFSALSLIQPNFVDFVIETTRANNVDPTLICIEITESAAFDTGQSSIDALVALHEVGFRIALDDFGTGYSSLAHLRDLPISTVKVDRSFVVRLGEKTSERAIAEAIVSLAGDLGLGLVAEGVETQQHLDDVQDVGFTTVQGWHYAPAMPLAECLDLWAEQVAAIATDNEMSPADTGDQ